MTATTTRVQALTAETIPLDDVRQLIPFLDARHPILWLRKGEGIAGIGEALRLEFSGPTRLTDAAEAWKDIVATSQVTDPIATPGSGLVAFGAFSFADDSSSTSVLIVPEVIIGRRNGRSWLTRVRLSDSESGFAPVPHPTPFGAEYRLTMLPGALSPEGYLQAVSTAIDRIADGDVGKVVLARDVRAHLPAESDLRRALVELALGYPDCWTYAVDGLVGSSPETLVRVNRGAVTARVLAGTTPRGADAAADHEAAVKLASSPKDRGEHDFAVSSVLDALAPHSTTLHTSEMPFTLKLPNLWHLATDIEGTLIDGSSALDLAAALHPTAAVAGTPTKEALALIAELEPFDRGRYAGPVGWIGADGDGEWAIALRSAQVAPGGDITAYAGCGIVAGSEPERELAETKIKFRPVKEAFG
ncbi:MAG TPA: isochorismate synthase [Microbacteriaceae bacterium]|nr:isochorismate synthase [Microbacteriaceae bacterium]